MAEPPAPEAPPTTAPEQPQQYPSWATDLEDLNLFPDLHFVATNAPTAQIDPDDYHSLHQFSTICEMLGHMLRGDSKYTTISPKDKLHILAITQGILGKLSSVGQFVLKRSYPPFVRGGAHRNRVHRAEEDEDLDNEYEGRGAVEHRARQPAAHESFLQNCAWLGMVTLRSKSFTMLPFLQSCLDTECHYYQPRFDTRTHTNTGGHVHVLYRLVNYFVGKYNDIVDILCSTPFIGVDSASGLLNVLNRLGPQYDLHFSTPLIDSDTAHATALRFMARLKDCTDDDLKMRYKQNEKSLEPLWFELQKLCFSNF